MTSICVSICLHMCVRQRTTATVIPFVLLMQDLRLAWDSPIKLGCLSRELQGSACLCQCQADERMLPCPAFFKGVLVKKFRSSSLQGKWLSYLPVPGCYFWSGWTHQTECCVTTWAVHESHSGELAGLGLMGSHCLPWLFYSSSRARVKRHHMVYTV